MPSLRLTDLKDLTLRPSSRREELQEVLLLMGTLRIRQHVQHRIPTTL